MEAEPKKKYVIIKVDLPDERLKRGQLVELIEYKIDYDDWAPMVEMYATFRDIKNNKIIESNIKFSRLFQGSPPPMSSMFELVEPTKAMKILYG